MFKGVVIENSLADKEILKTLSVEKTWKDGDWILHSVKVEKEQISTIAKALNKGPWYIHFWEPGKREVIAIYKDKVFSFDYDDISTWKPAIGYGKSLGIPEEQLDFPID